jgi:antitoxin component of MazEF toxin-antitoxin module
VTRAGNSIAIIVPAKEAKRVGLEPDRVVEVDIRGEVESPVGLFQRLGIAKSDIEKIRKDWAKDKSETWAHE